MYFIDLTKEDMEKAWLLPLFKFAQELWQDI